MLFRSGCVVTNEKRDTSGGGGGFTGGTSTGDDVPF